MHHISIIIITLFFFFRTMTVAKINLLKARKNPKEPIKPVTHNIESRIGL